MLFFYPKDHPYTVLVFGDNISVGGGRVVLGPRVQGRHHYMAYTRDSYLTTL